MSVLFYSWLYSVSYSSPLSSRPGTDFKTFVIFQDMSKLFDVISATVGTEHIHYRIQRFPHATIKIINAR